MDFTKIKNVPGIAVFLDFEKAFDSIEWEFIQKCLESFNLVDRTSGNGSACSIKTSPAASLTMALPLNTST